MVIKNDWFFLHLLLNMCRIDFASWLLIDLAVYRCSLPLVVIFSTPKLVFLSFSNQLVIKDHVSFTETGWNKSSLKCCPWVWSSSYCCPNFSVLNLHYAKHTCHQKQPQAWQETHISIRGFSRCLLITNEKRNLMVQLYCCSKLKWQWNRTLKTECTVH